MRINYLFDIHKIYKASTYHINNYKTVEPVINEENNKLPIVSYPQNYYVSFKGENSPREKQKFIDFLEYHYSLFGNKKITPETLYFTFGREYQSDVPKLNNEFIDMIKYEINNHQSEKLDVETIKMIIKSSLDAGLSKISKNMPAEIIQNYDKYLEDKTELVFNTVKEQNDISDTSYVKPDDVRNFVWRAYLDNENDIVNSTEDFFVTIAFHSFFNKLCDNVKNAELKIYNEQLLNKLKKNLDKEPFASYWVKINKINEQLKLNNVQSPDIIANEIYNDIVDNQITPFANPKFYKYLSDTSEKLDFTLDRIYGLYARDYVADFENSSIDKKHKSLLVDPGIYNNFEKLKKFVIENNIDTKKLETHELRQMFSQYLGNEIVYRGVYSKTPEKLIEKIKKLGNHAPVFKDKNRVLDSIKYYLGENYIDTDTIYGKIGDKTSYYNPQSEILSVSKIRDIAASVPKQNEDSSTPVVLIKAEIPKIDVLKQENKFRNMQPRAKHDVLRVGDKSYDYDTQQKDIEAFVLFYLPTKNAEITIDNYTPFFYWE